MSKHRTTTTIDLENYLWVKQQKEHGFISQILNDAITAIRENEQGKTQTEYQIEEELEQINEHIESLKGREVRLKIQLAEIRRKREEQEAEIKARQGQWYDSIKNSGILEQVFEDE